MFFIRSSVQDETAKSRFFVVRASSLRDLYCRQDACTAMGSHTRVKPILFAETSVQAYPIRCIGEIRNPVGSMTEPSLIEDEKGWIENPQSTLQRVHIAEPK